MQHTLSQQIKMSLAEHQPFLKLQAVDLGFDLPITPPRREGGTHRRVVTANALGKAFEFSNAGVLGLLQPGIQILVTTLCQHQDKGLTEMIGDLQIRVSLTDVLDVVALFLIKLCKLTSTEPGSTGRR